MAAGGGEVGMLTEAIFVLYNLAVASKGRLPRYF